MNGNYDVILFYDGQCPICRKEVAWLRWKNKRGRLALQDIHDPAFDPAIYGKTFDEFMAEIHGLYPDGRLIKGIEVFQAAYLAVGLGWLIAPLGWPLTKPFFAYLYRLFARHRLRLGRLFGANPCVSGTCGITPPLD